MLNFVLIGLQQKNNTMGQYWTRKNDKDDEDAGKTATPWSEKCVKEDRTNGRPRQQTYEEYCKMMARQQEEDLEDLCFPEQPEGVFVRGH